MIRIGIGLSLVVLAGFAATAAVDCCGEPVGQAAVVYGTDPAPGSPALPAWHPPVLSEGHAAVLPPGHPPVLPPAIPVGSTPCFPPNRSTCPTRRLVMIRIGIGLSLVVLAGFAATAAVDRRGESAGQALAAHAADPAPGLLQLPAWHPPVLSEGHAAGLPPGHPPILPPGHPPVAGDVLTCPGGGMLPGRAPGSDGGLPAETPAIISI